MTTFKFQRDNYKEFEIFLTRHPATRSPNNIYNFSYPKFATCFYLRFATHNLYGLRISKNFHLNGKFQLIDNTSHKSNYIYDYAHDDMLSLDTR